MSQNRATARTGAPDAAASGRPPDVLARPQAPVFVAVAVAALTLTALTTSRSAGLVAALWATGGVAVTVWLRGGKGRAYDLAYAALIATGLAAGNLLAGNSGYLTAMFITANMIEIVLAVVLVRRLLPDLDLGSVSGAARFLLFGAVIPPLPAALFAAAMLNYMTGQPFMTTFQTWWFGHALGVAVIAPFGLAVAKGYFSRLAHPLRIIEALGLLGGLALLSATVFVYGDMPVTFLVTPVLLLIAVRMRILGVTAGILIVALIAIIATMHGYGPMTAYSAATAEQVMLAQLYTLTACLPMLLVAAMLEERDRLAEREAAGRERAEKASAGKSRLLANVAHEIKSPIGGVIGIGDLWA